MSTKSRGIEGEFTLYYHQGKSRENIWILAINQSKKKKWDL
jgi:hypothetical protein